MPKCLQDVEWTGKLVEYMREHNMFDTEEGQSHRLLILGKLNELMARWIVQVSMEKVRKKPVHMQLLCKTALDYRDFQV